jgi:hypothetical protein
MSVQSATDARAIDQNDLVWYAAYGSNMHAERLQFYLSGGTPPGGRRTYPGCRDPTPPRRTRPLMLPGGIYFALESKAWTGGLALFDPDLPGEAAFRAYLISVGQFSDIATQEMYREPGTDLDVIHEVIGRGRVELGTGRYETLVYAGSHDGIPALTFTARWHADDIEFNSPAKPYVAMLASGLHESHGWTPREIVAYLGSRPGIAGSWTEFQLAEVVEFAVRRANHTSPTT